MSDYGIKVIKTGTPIESSDVRDMLMSSNYSMLKYYRDVEAKATISPGQNNAYVDIPHDLGYVPAFIAYYKDYSDNKLYYIPGLPESSDYSVYSYAYATNSIIRCGIQYTGLGPGAAYNQTLSLADGTGNLWSDETSDNTFILTGNTEGAHRNGALRFTNVGLAQGASIVTSAMNFAVDIKGAGPGNLDIKVYGIDEDNTATFVNSPMGRTPTSYVTSENVNIGSIGSTLNIEATGFVQEIVNRGSWASGNALGVMCFENSSNTNCFIEDDPYGEITTLVTNYGSSADLHFRVIIFKDKIA
jgi:hypothetical protein